jgi:hypothetical protein
MACSAYRGAKNAGAKAEQAFGAGDKRTGWKYTGKAIARPLMGLVAVPASILTAGAVAAAGVIGGVAGNVAKLGLDGVRKIVRGSESAEQRDARRAKNHTKSRDHIRKIKRVVTSVNNLEVNIGDFMHGSAPARRNDYRTA